MAISGTTILAGTSGGIFLSIDNGSIWINGNNGLPANTSITEFAINGTHIFAGTTGEGVWKRSLPEITEISEHGKNNRGLSIYPNPSSGRFSIYSGSNHAELKVNIYTLSGELIISEIPAQNQQEINVNGLSNGIHILEIKSNIQTEKQKLIIQR